MAEYYIDKDGKLKKREPAKALTSAVKKASNIKIAPVGTPRSTADTIKPTSVTVAPSITPTLSQAESEFVTRQILGSQEYQTKKDRTWFAKGYFDDGYQFGDLTKTTWATRGNIAKNVGEAIIGFGEKAVDALATMGQYMGEAELGAMPHYTKGQYEAFTEYKDVGRKQTSEFVAKDLYDEEKIADMLITNPFEKVTKLDTERGTFLGEKSQALVQSAAQLALQVGISAVTKGAVPWYVTTGLNVYGGEVENALRSGATLDEASLSATISTAGEILSEKLFGMYGGKMTDLLAQNIGKALGSKLVGSLIKAGFDIGGEGAEEVLSDYVSRFGQWLTYNDEKTLLQVLNSEDAIDERIEAFVGGMFLGGGFTASNVMNTKTDYLTGNDATVQKVIDAEVERIVAEAKKNGEKVKRAEIYNEVEDNVKRGYVTTDTIEAILGDEAYSEYKKALDTERAETERLNKEITSLEDKINSSEDISTEDREKLSSLRSELESLENNSKVKELKEKLDALVRDKVKGTSLAESYNEIERQTETFKADLSKYTAKEQRIVQKAIDSGILNNTNRSHELVDLIAKLSAHLDTDFDFVNNERLKASGFAIEGKTVNGYVTKDGITINVQSPKYLNSVVGHEITHVLKGSKLFNSLQNTLFDYAKSRGEYDARLNTLTETYKGIENVDINEELTADLVGDYIFTDRKFVEHLLNTNKSVFQKIYDELKYLCKIATTGSKEEKSLLKAKKIFDEVYSKGETNSVEGVKYDVSNWSEQKNQTQAEITINYQRSVDDVLRGNYSGDSSVIMGYTPSIYQEMGMPSLPFVIGTGHIYSAAKTKSEAIQENKYNKKNNYHGLGKQTVKNLYEAVKDPIMIISSKDVKPNAKPLRSTHSIVSIVDVGTNGKHLLLPIEITATRTVNGNKMDVNVLSSAYEKNVSELIKEAVALENTGDVGFYYIKNGDTTIVDSGVQFPVHLNDRISPNGIIRSFSEKVNMNLSDVTQSQQFKRWFGDWQNRPQKASKVVNEDGTPLIMYHGTNSDAFTVFDSTKSDKKVKLNTLGDGYYFTKSKERASRYGENIIETYLDIKKPYRVYPRDGGIKAQIEEDFGISADSLHRNDIQSILKSKGYDGILLHYSKYHDTDWETAVVFEPTQIKSATDNVGTYDKNNPNINYSLSPIAPETSPGGTLKITSDDVTLKAPLEANESVDGAEDITFEEASPFADEPTLTELKAERDGKFSNAEKSYVSTEKRLPREELHNNIIERIKSRFAKRGFDFDEILSKAKDLSTFATVDNTPQRVMEKSLGYMEGQILADETVNKVAQNETEGIKWLNNYIAEIKKISKEYGIKPNSKASAAAQMYAEGFYVAKNGDIIEYGDNELEKDFPDDKVRENIKRLANNPRIRQIYDDTLSQINESRKRNGYPEIPKLDNYFLHFRAMDDTFSRLGLPFNPNDIRAKDLPTDLNGVTADLKPGQPYFASSMHREGKRTSFDLLGGLERYLSSAKNQIFHIDDIQTLRALRNYIADTYGQAKGLESLDSLTEDEAQEKIKQVYDSHLSTFAKFLNEEANILAGKTSLIDRGIEGIIGRRGIAFLDSINKQVGSNMVGWNAGSSLTNILPVVETFAKTNKFAFAKAFAQTVANKIGRIFGKSDGFAENSPVIIRRKGAERFSKTPYQKIADTGYLLMSAVDDISTEIIARTKYNELIKKGMDSQQAQFETDKWVSRLMGDRSLGQQPQIFNSKMLGLFTKFQLEVRNLLDSQFYDTIQEAKASNEYIENALKRNAKTAAKVTSTFFQLAVLQHVFGRVFESVVGYNPVFDIVSVLATALGFDDDEDSEDTALDNLSQGFLELLEDLPYTSVLTGGRVPISSALPIPELVQGVDQYGNEKSRLETLSEAIPYYVLPTGYGQIKKTAKGLSMFDDDLPISGSYTDAGKLRYPVEATPGNVAQAALFGQYASKNAREYFDKKKSPLNDKQLEEFLDSKMPISKYWDYREGLKDKKKAAEKADYINDLDVPLSTKNLLINNQLDRKKPFSMKDYDKYGSFEEADDAQKDPEKYALTSHVFGYDAYQKYQSVLKQIKGEWTKNRKARYIQSLKLSAIQKKILFKSEYPSDHSHDYEIIQYIDGLKISKKEKEKIARALGFEVKE